MRRRRRVSTILCLALVLALIRIPLLAHAEPEPGETMTVLFELRDATTRESIPVTDATFTLYDQDDEPIAVEKDENEDHWATADLVVGETYSLTVTLLGYHTSREIFTAGEGHGDNHDRVEIFVVSKDDFGEVPEDVLDALSIVVLGDRSGLEANIAIAGEMLGDFSADCFSVLLIDNSLCGDDGYDIETDGLPIGMWEAPPEPLHHTRKENILPGEYTLFVAFFQEVDGDHGHYRVPCGYTTYLLEVVEPGDNEIHMVIVAEGRPGSSRISGAQVSLLGGEEHMAGTTDSCGRCAFTVEKDSPYDIKVSMSGYYAANEGFAFNAHDREHNLSLYAIGDLVRVPEEAIVTEIHEYGHPGVDVGINSETPGFPSGFVYEEFAVLALKDETDWDAEDDGIPGGVRNARRGHLGDIVNLNVETGEEGDYLLFIAFYGKIGDDHHAELIGFAVTGVTITPVSGGHDPGPTDVLEISWQSFEPVDEAIITVDWSPGWDCTVNILASESGTIEFPSQVGERTLVLRDLDAPPWADFSLDSFDGAIDGNTLFYGARFDRIVLVFEVDGFSECHVVLVQPGYEEALLQFVLYGEDGNEIQTFTMGNDGSWEERHRAFELPPNLASGYIEAGAANGAVTNFGGGIWEYLVDRSEYVWSSPDQPLSFKRHFGKVTMHYQYQIGYSWGDAMVTFYEPDYVGIRVRPQIGAGDWHTGITNASQAALDLDTPTAFVYFLNTQVHISPEGIGMHVEITGVSSEEEGVTVAQEFQHDTLGWTVTLPDLTKPVTRLELELDFGEGDIRIVPLDVKRVLLDAFTSQYPEESESGDTLITPRGTEYEYKGEEFTTFVGVFAFTEDPGDPDFFEIDHTLLVNYYHDDVLLGTRQFAVQTEVRDEVIVFRQGVAEYASLASANRITAFLITKDGVKAEDDTFGGAVFGVGAGWGHLMPNHDDYGTGKDGMR